MSLYRNASQRIYGIITNTRVRRSVAFALSLVIVTCVVLRALPFSASPLHFDEPTVDYLRYDKNVHEAVNSPPNLFLNLHSTSTSTSTSISVISGTSTGTSVISSTSTSINNSQLSEETDQLYNSNSGDQSGYDWAINLVNKHNPNLSHTLEKYYHGQAAKQKFAIDNDFIFSKEYLDDLVIIDDESLQKLKRAHEGFVKDIKNDDHKWFGSDILEPQSNGIVFVGGVKFSWLSLVSIEKLRQTGCTLPIEVFIATPEEYEPELCSPKILGRYNARCTYLPSEMGMLEDRFEAKVNGFQYKALALLVSRFENILFLDADNAPVDDPSYLFESSVFKDNGLVVWPDPWVRTTTPKFYEIAGLQVENEIVRGHKFDEQFDGDYDTDINYHDLKGTIPTPTSESGMLLVSKKRNRKSLLLSLYYNIYGPHLYYTILTQGSAGEGDKETFTAAAFVMKESCYQVQTMLQFKGYFHQYDQEFKDKALAQVDPEQDYQNWLKGYRFLGKNNPVGLTEPRIKFMHMSYPKYTPQLLVDNAEFFYYKDGNKTNHRLYTGITKTFGYDFELSMFRILTSLMCKEYEEGENFVLLPGVSSDLKFFDDFDKKPYCDTFIKHVGWLTANPE